MKHLLSRRHFLAGASLGLPAASLGTALAKSSGPSRGPLQQEPPTERGRIPYAILGRTGIKVTPFIFGSMITSDPTLIERAVDMGVNCFATARDYQNGNNERLLGVGLKGRRQKVVILTESLDIDVPGRPSRSQETVRLTLEWLNTSLRELGTDYVDLWLLHHKDAPEHITDNLMEAVRIAKKDGKIRFAGVSTHRLPVILEAVVNNPEMDVVMAIYNFTMDDTMDAAVETAHKPGRGVIAIKVMAGGLRTEHPLPQMKRPGALQAALKWAINNPSVDAAVTSVTDIDQLEDNFNCMTSPFTEEERQLLAECLEIISSEYCRSCGRCDGTCARGLPVADMLRYLTYVEGYGQFSLGREKFLSLPDSLRRVQCRDCPACTVQCHFGVGVAGRLARAQELLA